MPQIYSNWFNQQSASEQDGPCPGIKHPLQQTPHGLIHLLLQHIHLHKLDPELSLLLLNPLHRDKVVADMTQQLMVTADQQYLLLSLRSAQIYHLVSNQRIQVLSEQVEAELGALH
jgi:hypothetical protein